jgi:hypothetical protein
VHPGELVMQQGEVMIACDMLYITSSNPNQTLNSSEVQLNGEFAVKTIISHPFFKQKEFPNFLL